MKLDWKLWLIIGLTLAVILLILLRPQTPTEDNSKKAYQDTIEALRVERAFNRARIDSVFRASKTNAEQTKQIVAAKNEEISVLKVKASKQRVVVQPIIDNSPELKAFIATQDSILRATEAKADTLQRAFDFQLKVTDSLNVVVIDKQQIEDQMFTECSKRVDKLEKDKEKERKKKTVWKRIAESAIVVIVVETVIILAGQ